MNPPPADHGYGRHSGRAPQAALAGTTHCETAQPQYQYNQVNRKLYIWSHLSLIETIPRLSNSFFSEPLTFFKYSLAFEINLCIMPLFMQFYGGAPCPARYSSGFIG
jgi:hypothetical protein